jgi:multidrug resistance efflux pump
MPNIPDNEQHSRKEITDFLNRNYDSLEGNTAAISIGVLGRFYRVVVTDTQHVMHTFKIDPKDIDADIARVARDKATGDNRLDQARKAAATLKAKSAPDKDHDREKQRALVASVKSVGKNLRSRELASAFKARQKTQTRPGKDIDREK